MKRIFAGLVFATFLTGAASASSFVTPEPMTAKLGPSMIALGEPASEPIAAEKPAAPDKKVAKAIDQTPLEYPFPGGKVPVVRASGKIAVRTPLNYPVPADDPKPAEAAPQSADVTFVEISPSIIAMAPGPAVSFEEVAAVGGGATDAEASRRDSFGSRPTVIRGGVVDDGGATAASVPATPAKKQASVGHSPAMARSQPVASGNSAPQAAASKQAPPKQPDVPIPSSTPAPPPAGIVPQSKIQ